MVTKGSIQQEDITIINIHAPDKPLKYMKQKLMEPKREINSFTIKAGDFNTPKQKWIE